MLSVNRTATIVQQVVEFAAHLRQMLQWAEKTLTCLSEGAGLTAQCECFHDHQKSPSNTENDAHGQTIANSTTFCAQWGDKTCYLGDTLPFLLLERLARRPNRLFRYDILLQDVWKCKRSKEAVRSVVKVLRQKLRAAGMEDLAEAIDGTTAQHYGLMIDGHFRRLPTGFTQVPTAVSHSTMPQ
jgi:DNA-binding response OmpR family regulator